MHSKIRDTSIPKTVISKPMMLEDRMLFLMNHRILYGLTKVFAKLQEGQDAYEQRKKNRKQKTDMEADYRGPRGDRVSPSKNCGRTVCLHISKV